MKVLFVGGTGTISSACAALAIQHGIELYLLSRGLNTRPVPAGAISLQGDIHQPELVAAVLGQREFDAVVESGGIYTQPGESGYGDVPRSHQAIYFHQLGLGIPETSSRSAHYREHTAG